MMSTRTFRSWSGSYADANTIIADLKAGFGVEDILVRHPGVTADRVRGLVQALRDSKRLKPAFFAPLVHQLAGGAPQ